MPDIGAVVKLLSLVSHYLLRQQSNAVQKLRTPESARARAMVNQIIMPFYFGVAEPLRGRSIELRGRLR